MYSVHCRWYEMGANSIVCVAASLILHHQSWSPVVAMRFTLITFWFRLKAIRTRATRIIDIVLIVIIFIFIMAINIISLIIMMMITIWFWSEAIRTQWAPPLCDHITPYHYIKADRGTTFNIGVEVEEPTIQYHQFGTKAHYECKNVDLCQNPALPYLLWAGSNLEKH